MLSERPPCQAALLREAGLRPKKSWGQNFLCDQSVLRDIAAAARAPTVLELGAGLGALTWYLLKQGSQVVAVERDRELVPLLRAQFADFPQLNVREADAARLDYQALAAELGGPLHVAGNLPYQLSSRILVNLADAAAAVESAVLLVQREVATRLAAAPGRDRGLLSVLVQRTFDVQHLRHVAPGAFIPAPKVHSCVVMLQRRQQPYSAAQHRQLTVAARAAFSARRKTLRNALSGALQRPAAAMQEIIELAGLSPMVRAEALQLEDFVRLGEAMTQHGVLPEGAVS